jgi:serine/threonine protein phosphatase PrpC
MKLMVLFLAACRLFAQNAFWIDISGDWRYKLADRPEFASPGYGDSGWKTLRLPRTVAPPPRDPSTVYHEVSLRFDGQLTLLSDGVLEAANAKDELFGFERSAAISKKPAAKIAEAARAGGQNDDITVVTVRRNG